MNGGEPVSTRADYNGSRVEGSSRRGEKGWPQQLEQWEMRQVVGAELKFKSVRSTAFGVSRHTSILNKNVELLALGVEIEVQESNSLTLGDVAKGVLDISSNLTLSFCCRR
jgi:hypothetical protein